VTDSPLDFFDPGNLTDQEAERHAHLRGLIAAGIEPYPARVQRTHTIAEARALYENAVNENGQENGGSEETVTVTGRLTRNRDMGKISFADLEDGTGKIQILVRRDNLPENYYNDIWKKLIDLGDFIGVTGKLMTTKTGELSVDAVAIQFLSKTLKPMPDKWHGVRDRETRYRRRYVD
jgi:lysyl-tRNA synthetase class 2